MASDMTAIAPPRLRERGVDERMIGSSVELIGHLAQAVHVLGGSKTFTRVAQLGPLRVRLTLHGGGERTDIFDAFPSVRAGLSFTDAVRNAQRIDFAIDVIDGTRCGVARPRLKWRAADFGPKRLVPGWSDTARTTYFLRGECGLAAADWRSDRAYVWLPSIEALTAYERAAPFRWIIDGVAQRRGLTTMHAAAIGEGGIGLLIVGEGGRGKSTLALAAIDAGMDYLADDYCLVEPRPPYPAYRLFNTAKLRPDNKVALNWIADGGREIEPVPGGKLIFDLARHAPYALADRLEIRALLLPEFAESALPVLEMVSPHEAFCRAAPSTVTQCEGSERQTIADIGRIARALPCYRIRMPREPRRSIEPLRELLKTLRPPAEDRFR
jgi:hypothetical protein